MTIKVRIPIANAVLGPYSIIIYAYFLARHSALAARTLSKILNDASAPVASTLIPRYSNTLML